MRFQPLGMPLADPGLPRSYNCLDEEVAQVITYQVCDALRYLHTVLKIVHRDLKPSVSLSSTEDR